MSARPEPPKKRYIGDAVYAEFDGFCIWLSTHNGIRELERIGLEPSTLAALDEYREYVNQYRSDMAEYWSEAEGAVTCDG